MLTPNLSITIKQVLALAAMVEGKVVPSNMVANTYPTTLLIKSNCHKISPLHGFALKFGKSILMCSVNFWHHQDSNSLFKVGWRDWSRDFLMQLADMAAVTSRENALQLQKLHRSEHRLAMRYIDVTINFLRRVSCIAFLP